MDIQVYQAKLQQLEADLQRPEVLNNPQQLKTLTKDYSETKNILDLAQAVAKLQSQVAALEDSLATEADQAMKNLTTEEIGTLKKQLLDKQQELKDLVEPADPSDKKNIIMEIRAGTGGDESALFAAELLRMYSRYAERQGWKNKVLSSSRTSLGGFKEAILEIHGQSVYKYLKYESGVHRVQRVPETEKAGRVHTS